MGFPAFIYSVVITRQGRTLTGGALRCLWLQKHRTHVTTRDNCSFTPSSGSLCSLAYEAGSELQRGVPVFDQYKQWSGSIRQLEQISVAKRRKCCEVAVGHQSLILASFPSGIPQEQAKWQGRAKLHSSGLASCGSTPKDGESKSSDGEEEATGIAASTLLIEEPVVDNSANPMDVEAATVVEDTSKEGSVLEASIIDDKTDLASVPPVDPEAGVIESDQQLHDSSCLASSDSVEESSEATPEAASAVATDKDGNGSTTDDDGCQSNGVSAEAGTESPNADVDAPEDSELLSKAEELSSFSEEDEDQGQGEKKDTPKRKNKPKYKIDRKDLENCNGLGENGLTMLSPDKLRADTRGSILKLLSDESGNGSGGPPLESSQHEDANGIVNGTPPPVGSRKHEPVMLLTIGCQGSGKTKFSLDLVQYGAIEWARVNQDTIRGTTTRGLRQECVSKARQLLSLGYCIIVDRMNYCHDQREEFIELAKELGLTIHGIVFKLPFEDNVYNVANRTDHEGGFQGDTDSHKAIIEGIRRRLFRGGGMPRLVQGDFATLVVCESNEQYAAAFRQWVNYGRPMPTGGILTMQMWKEFVSSRKAFTNPQRFHPRPVPKPVPQTMHQAAVGYVPGRDGPLLADSSEEEAEETDDE